MIDVKIIKKPKAEGAPSARQTAGTAYGSRTVKEAAHAARADMAELAKVAEKAREADRAHDLTPDSPAYNRFLRKDADDKAAGVVDFLKGLRLAGKALTGILTTGDTAGASEANVLSALRTLATFIRKDRPDTMPHLLKLLDGLETGTFAAGRTGGRIDRAGNGELGSLTLRDLLTAVRVITGDVRSKNYTPGDMGTGFGLTTGEGGSRLEVDYLLVRRVATFLELVIREMRHVGGTLVLSGASGKVVRVEDKPSAWRVYFKTREDGTTVAHGFTVGAQARCQTYNRTSGNTYYWRLVTAVGDDWVELSKFDYDHAAPTGTARTAPAIGDELVQLGHRTDSRQMGAIVLDTVGEGAPSIRLLTDIRSYSLTDANVRVLLSPTAVRVIADEVSFASSGKTVEETITDSERAVKNYFNEQKKEIDSSIGEVSGKVDNLVIGGRNLLVSTQFTKRDSYQTVRGTYHIELDSTERYQGNNSLKLTNTKAGKIYEDVLVSGEQPAAGEYITVSLYAKAAAAGTRLSVRVCDNGEVQQTTALTTAWQRISFTFHGLKTPSRAIGIWFDRAGTVWIALPKMEVGNKATDWSPAPEDVASDAVAKANKALQDAKTYANGIQQGLAKSLDAARTELKKHAADLDAALLSNAQLYADGKVTESEKRMVEDNRKKLQSEQEAATKRLNEAIAGALTTAKGYVKDVQVGGRNYFGFHKEVRVSHHGTLSPDNNGVVFRNGDVLNCRIQNLNLPGAGWYAVSMFIRATKACTIASINLCDAVSKDRTLEKVSVTTSFRYITGVFHAERFINDNVWNGFLDFESSIDPSIEVTVRDLMITPGNQPMSWVPAPEDLYADIAAKAKAAQDAAKKYTEEQDRYYQTLHNAYADDQVTASEKRMIKDAEEKLQEAKRDAQAKADVALNTANQHTNAIKDTLNSAIGAAQTAAKNVQTNLDNLTIGGRNLLRYSALECPHITDALQLRGGHTAIVDKSQLYRGAPSAKISALPGQSGLVDFGWRTWIEVQNGHKVAPLVMTFAAKSSVAGVSMCCRLGWIGEVMSVIQLTTEWKEYTLRLNPTRDWIVFIAWMNQACTVWISRPKLEYGTKPTDWTPAPEDVDNSIAGVRNTANQASSDASQAKQKAGEAATKAGEAATSAGKAESSAKNAEASANAAKGKATEAAGSAKTASDKATNAANSASAAAGSASAAATNATNAAGSAKNAEASAKTAKADAEAAAQSAKDSKAAADAAKTRLDSWAADNVISPMEKQGLRDETARIDADKSQVAAGYAKYGLGSYQSFTDAYNAYRAVLVALSSTKQETIAIPADFATKQRNYYTQRSTALTRIADAAKEYVDGLQIGGRNLAVSSARHNFASSGSTPRPVVSFIEDKTVPSGVIIQIKCEKDCKPGFYSHPNPVQLTVGEKYTWSFYAKCSVKKSGIIGSEQGGQRNISLTTEWQRFTHTFTVPKTTYWAFTWYLNWNAGEVLYIHSFKLEKGGKPTDWTPAPEDITSEIAAKTEAARQAAQAEAIGLNKWIAQAFATPGENNAATPPKLEDIAGKTPTRTVELKDAQFNVAAGSGSVFGMDYYTGIRTTYVYLDADYNLTTGIQHDDAGSLYVNGMLVASGGLQSASWKSVTLPLKRGWNRIDGLWNEGGGGDYFKFQAPLENDAHIIQLACRPNVNIDPMRAVTMTTLTKKYSEIVKTNESIEQRVGKTEESIQEVDKKVTGFTTVDKNGQVLIKPENVWAGVETKVKQLSDESLKKLSIGGRNFVRNSMLSSMDAIQTRGTYTAKMDDSAKMFGYNSLKLENANAGALGSDVCWFCHSRVPAETVTISLYAKASAAGTQLFIRPTDNGELSQKVSLTTDWQRFAFTFTGRMPNAIQAIGIRYDRAGTVWVALPKMELGTKGTDWTPAPEDLPTIDTLSRTGIDIQQGVITLDANKVQVKNGSQTAAMFDRGKLKAELIDASRIDASKLNAADIFSQNITVQNNATITNLRAKDAVVEGKLEAASGSTIGGMTGYSSFLGFEAQRGTTSERILRIGTQAVPLSTGQHGMLYLTDKQRDAFKTIVYIESLGKEEKRWSLEDARAHNKAIHIASGTLRVDPGNLVDMPGVLLSGRVSETGHVEYEYGRRRMGMGLAAFSVQLHDGRDWVGYTVTHNLGHTNYTVQATPYTPGWTWRKYMMHVDQLTANYFTLLCIDTGTDNRQVKGSFMFTVIGENTAD